MCTLEAETFNNGHFFFFLFVCWFADEKCNNVSFSWFKPPPNNLNCMKGSTLDMSITPPSSDNLLLKAGSPRLVANKPDGDIRDSQAFTLYLLPHFIENVE